MKSAAVVAATLLLALLQDSIVSQVSAAFYAKLPAEGPKSDAVLKAMTDRVVGTMGRFKAPQDDARAFTGVAKTRGMDAYGRAMFGTPSGK